MSSTDLSFFDFSARGESVRALISDFRLERMAPATLLTGAPGIGKKTLASLLAKGLLCTGEGEKPCGVCRACRRFDARTHPDLLYPVLAAAEKTIKIDPIRDILDALSRHAFEGGKRAVLLLNAERMTPQAQNCLLKSLEEADEGTYFLLTADQETAVLTTIRSRCRIVRMQPMTDEAVQSALKRAGFSETDAARAALLCEGSVGRAKQLLEDIDDKRIRELVLNTFFAVRDETDIPALSLRLKDCKDDADKLLTDFEQEVRLLLRERAGLTAPTGEFPPLFGHASLDGLARLLTSSLNARKMRAANVNWQAVADRLLENIAEEITIWQQ